MPTVMIIGASRGIGLELARQYAAAGWRVHATTRTPAQPGALGAIGGEVVIHPLDVRSAPQIETLAQAVATEGIDVLIHNAGVSGRGMDPAEVRRINTDAPIHVAQALLPAVTRSSEKKIVLVTSQLGARRGYTVSLGLYGDSKAALNDAFRAHAPAWGRGGLHCDRHASGVGAHRHGRSRGIFVSGGKRPRHPSGHCPLNASGAWPLLDLGGARASVVRRGAVHPATTWTRSLGIFQARTCSPPSTW